MRSKKAPSRSERIQKNLEVIKKLPEGKEFISDILAYCKHGQSPFVAGSSDVTNFNLGRQDVALLISKKDTNDE